MGTHIAFGIEPGRRAPYELRQARYMRLAEVVSEEVRRVNREEHRRADLLDVGTSHGRILRYLEPHVEDEAMNLTGVDLFPLGMDRVYRHQTWRLLEMDLEHGMPQLDSEAYDIVVCEQVLEHLERVEPALNDIERTLRPGGIAVLGVPIFPLGTHRLRPAAIRVLDTLTGPGKHAHVRAWSLATFLQDLERLETLEVRDVRGFRIASGGLLRPLEFRRWWWRLNGWLGRHLPGLCVEVQVVLRKRSPAAVGR